MLVRRNCPIARADDWREVGRDACALKLLSNWNESIIERSATYALHSFFKETVMLVRQPRYAPEVAARLGDEIYERSIRHEVEAGHRGEYVAIDIESGEWEMDQDEDVSSERLLARIPDAQTYVTRIGYGYIRRFGAGRIQKHA